MLIIVCLNVFLCALPACLSVCLSVCLPFFLSFFLCVCLSVCLSVCRSVCLSVLSSIYLIFLCPFSHASVRQSTCLSFHLSFFPSILLALYWFVFLFSNSNHIAVCLFTTCPLVLSSICLSALLSTSPFHHSYICCLFIHLSICLFVCPSVHAFILLSVYLFIRQPVVYPSLSVHPLT
jgi:hypothetical protein